MCPPTGSDDLSRPINSSHMTPEAQLDRNSSSTCNDSSTARPVFVSDLSVTCPQLAGLSWTRQELIKVSDLPGLILDTSGTRQLVLDLCWTCHGLIRDIGDGNVHCAVSSGALLVLDLLS